MLDVMLGASACCCATTGGDAASGRIDASARSIPG
jgi:hypothetical protein